MIDWELAISTGVRFARQGPNVSLAEARAVVAELRGLTAVVQQPVRDVTGLVSQGSVGPVAVVDRPGWIRANVGGFRVVLEPLADRLSQRGAAGPGSGVMGAVGSPRTGCAPPRERWPERCAAATGRVSSRRSRPRSSANCSTS